MFKKVNLEGSTFVEGFPGVGLVGPMSISYMIDKLQMEYVGYLEGQNFPPLISIHKGQPMPPVRVYCSAKSKVVTIFAEFSMPLELVKDVSDAVYAFIQKSKIATIYSIGGIPMGIPSGPGSTKKSVFGICSKKSLESQVVKAGHDAHPGGSVNRRWRNAAAQVHTGWAGQHKRHGLGAAGHSGPHLRRVCHNVPQQAHEARRRHQPNWTRRPRSSRRRYGRS